MQNEKRRIRIAARSYTQVALYMDTLYPELKTVPWEEAAEEVKASYLDVYDFYAENPNRTFEDLHQRFVIMRKSEGYTYGEVSNEQTKKDSRLCSYKDLPEQLKIKDAVLYTAMQVQLSFTSHEINAEKFFSGI